MKITSFKVSNFRSLLNSPWVPINNITVITGQNDGGKTSFLQALAIFLDPKHVPEILDYSYKDENNGEQEAIITFEARFSLDKGDIGILEQQTGFPAPEIHVVRRYSPDKPEPYKFKTQVHPDSNLNGDLESLNIGELLGLCDKYSISTSDRKKKASAITAIRFWKKSQQLIDGEASLPLELVALFPKLHVFYSAEAFNPEAQITSTLKASFADKIASDTYSGEVRQITDKIVAELKNEVADLVPLIKNYAPEIETIEVVPSFDFSSGFRTSKLQLKKKQGYLVDLDKGGEGGKRRITLAVYDWRLKIFQTAADASSKRQLILAFDEPDTHLDYHSQRQIFDVIRKLAEKGNTSVLVCTHSLNLLDRIPLTNVVHLELEKGRTKVNLLSTEDANLVDLFLYQLSDNMGLRNSSLLNEKCFLVVEGATEISALPILFHKKYGMSMQAAGIQILNGENNYGARLLAKFLNQRRKNVVFLVDSDVQVSPIGKFFTRESFKEDGIDETRQVHYIGKKEFEDAFEDDHFAAAGNVYWPKFSSMQWTKLEFLSIRNGQDFTEQLLHLIRRECRQHITKPQIGFSLAKTIDANRIPAEVILCFENAYNIANG